MRLLNFSKRHKNDLNSFATNKLVIQKTACSLAVRLEFSVLNTVLGKLPPRKIAPSPNSNANPKPNPDPDRGAILLGGNFPDTAAVDDLQTMPLRKILLFLPSNSLTV